MKIITSKITVTALFVLLSVNSGGVIAQRQLLDRVVAIVDEGVVLQSELDMRLREIHDQSAVSGRELPPPEQLREEVLEALIVESLQLQVAERVSIRYDDDTVNRVLLNMAQNNNLTFNEYIAILEQRGVYLQTREQVRKQLTLQELQRGLVNSRIAITDQEIENFLNSEMGREIMAASYRVHHMLIPTSVDDSDEIRQAKLAYAADLVARTNEGEDLLAVRANAQRSDTFRVDGTEFGWRKANQLPNLFAGIVESMAIGAVEGPIEAGNGYHIIQLAEKEGGTEQIVEQTHVRHILLRPNEIRTEQQTQDAIVDLHQRIEAGENFASLARQNSDDDNTVVAGGDLDWITKGGLPPDFERVVDELDVGEYSQPFRTQAGWHIVEVLGRRQEDLSQEYARNQAENALRDRKFDLELQNWLIELREEAFVEIVD